MEMPTFLFISSVTRCLCGNDCVAGRQQAMGPHSQRNATIGSTFAALRAGR
jgi:hypothetical protein